MCASQRPLRLCFVTPRYFDDLVLTASVVPAAAAAAIAGSAAFRRTTRRRSAAVRCRLQNSVWSHWNQGFGGGSALAHRTNVFKRQGKLSVIR